jgi:gluconokinase
MKYVFAFDLGTTHTKYALYNESAVMLYHAVKNSPTLHITKEGHIEIEPDDVYKLFLSSLSETLKNLNLRPEDSIYVSISGMVPTFILLKNEKEPLTNGILYNDLRFSKIFKKLAPYRQDFFIETGNPLDTQHWLVRLKYFKEMFPDKIKKTQYITDVLSYILFRLSGKNIMSLSVAHASGLLNYRTLGFNRLIIEMFGEHLNAFPKIKKYSENLVTNFNLQGKPVKIYLKPPISDAMASAYSLGAHDGSAITVNIGTTATLFYRLNKPKPSRYYFLNISPSGDYYFAIGSTAAAGGYTDYVFNLIKANYSEIPESIKKTNVLEIPYIWGEKSPFFNPNASAAIVNLRGYNTKIDLALASIESVAYSIYNNLKYIKQNNYEITEIRISGMLGKYRVLQMALSCLANNKVIYYKDVDERYAHYVLAMDKFNLTGGQLTQCDSKYTKYYKDKFIKYIKLYKCMNNLYNS